MKCLVVIPAHNEVAALPATLLQLQHLPLHYDLLVVDDGSTDGTSASVNTAMSKFPTIRMIHLPQNCGIGVAVQAGYRFATAHGGYDYVVQFDADGQHDMAFLVPMLQHCIENRLDLCIGSRFLDDSQCGYRSTAARRIGIRFLAMLISGLTRRSITDPTSGLRFASRTAYSHFAEQYPEDFPEPESLYWCIKNGLAIGEYPVLMRERQGGVSSIRHLKSIYYMLKVTFSILTDSVRSRERISV